MYKFWTLVTAVTVLAFPLVAFAATEVQLRVTNDTQATEVPVRVTPKFVEDVPAVDGSYLAWQQSRDVSRYAATSVYAQVGAGEPFRVHSRNTYARMGGIDGSRLVYAGYRKLTDEGVPIGDTLRMLDLETRAPLPLPGDVNTKREEFAPSISGSWLMFGRRDTGRRIRLDLLLRNLDTGETRVLVNDANSSLAPGQVNGSFVVWNSCGKRVCDVYRYDIASGTTVQVPNPDGKLQYSPGVSTDGTVYFFRSGFGCGTSVIFQMWSPAMGATLLVDFPSGIDGSGAYISDEVGAPRQVMYSRVRCLKDKYAPAPSDLYKLVE